MGRMKGIYSMLEVGVSRDTLAWYLLRETKVSDWFLAKKIAGDMIEQWREMNEA